MAKQETNIFGSFGVAAQERQAEQQRIEARVTGQAAPSKPRAAKRASGTAALGRPRKRLDATTMTISISQADKDQVKSYAFAHAVTVSDLIHTWINEHCVEE